MVLAYRLFYLSVTLRFRVLISKRHQDNLTFLLFYFLNLINKTPFFPHIYLINITRADGTSILYETHTTENAINTTGMTKIEGASIESFEEALKLLNHNTTFAWTIPENYWQWREHRVIWWSPEALNFGGPGFCLLAYWAS